MLTATALHWNQTPHTYPASHPQPPKPLALPWALKPMGSADFGVDTLPDGRTRYWIRHDVVHGVTPRMLAWWFANLEGDIEIEGQRYNRYRVWHPYDHVHASYAQRLPDGSVGPGAVIRLREYIGANRRYLVNIHTRIEKLDEEGYIHNPMVHGIGGLARMEYRFTRVPGGTLYENCLIFGHASPWFRVARPLVAALAFPQGKGEAWLRHNIEEVGALEHFLPGLYHAHNMA
ncbi:DAPG hydrolase family protein [Hydrogenophaga sp.]|uniref:DAPG hydrolase family protein n=1 Tax=Hydrogenophaga sp. TaxID=1904254 RepID=UPI0027180054|nr:hypothetical protein [Hydrogenophaga sp.]MDO8903089.1 hypothetical protein [Hydrogenophaga sp.]